MREAHKILLAVSASVLAAVAAAMIGIAIGRAGKEPNSTVPEARAAARAMTFTTRKPDTP